jgi:hypothetical protein
MIDGFFKTAGMIRRKPKCPSGIWSHENVENPTTKCFSHGLVYIFI